MFVSFSQLQVNTNPRHDYCKFKLVGVGGYGSVYMAIDKTTGAQVAIKKIKLEGYAALDDAVVWLFCTLIYSVASMA